MNDSITIQQVVDLLNKDNLLVEYSCPQELLNHPFDYLSYSSADVQPNTFFICKGASFKEAYLQDAISKLEAATEPKPNPEPGVVDKAALNATINKAAAINLGLYLSLIHI